MVIQRAAVRCHQYCSAISSHICYNSGFVFFSFPWHQCFLVDFCGSLCFIYESPASSGVLSVGVNGLQKDSESYSLVVSLWGRSHWRKCLCISFLWANEPYLWCIGRAIHQKWLKFSLTGWGLRNPAFLEWVGRSKRRLLNLSCFEVTGCKTRHPIILSFIWLIVI